MKRTILYFVLWCMLADIANYTDSNILLVISCAFAVFMIRYIVKNNAKNE